MGLKEFLRRLSKALEHAMILFTTRNLISVSVLVFFVIAMYSTGESSMLPLVAVAAISYVLGVLDGGLNALDMCERFVKDMDREDAIESLNIQGKGQG